jgi:hypothetical protein
MNDKWVIVVTDRLDDEVRQYYVQIRKEVGMHGLQFGSCICRRQKVLGAPCSHMVIAVKTGIVPELSEENIMPYWSYTKQFRLQYPQECVFKAGMNMTLLKNMGLSSPSLYYCPDFAGPVKTGRPKNNARIVGILESGCRRGQEYGDGGGGGVHVHGHGHGQGYGGCGRGGSGCGRWEGHAGAGAGAGSGSGHGHGRGEGGNVGAINLDDINFMEGEKADDGMEGDI